MRTMPNFVSVRLPSDPGAPDYQAAIAAFRQWAGPTVCLGTADHFVTGKEGELLLHELLLKRIEALHLTPSEMYGCTLFYIAETPSDAVRSDTGWVEALRMDMRIDPGEIIWVTGMSVVERVRSEVAEWKFQLTPQVRELAIASFFVENGVDPGLDYDELANFAESEAARMAASTPTCA